MTLRDKMARHAQILTRSDHFGEEVTYVFKSDGSERTVRAVVDRLNEEPEDGMPQVAMLRAILAIPNNATNGITTVNPGDKVILAMRLGGAAQTVRVRRILFQDEGMFTIEVG